MEDAGAGAGAGAGDGAGGGKTASRESRAPREPRHSERFTRRTSIVSFVRASMPCDNANLNADSAEV